MDHSLSGSSVHGILQVKNTEVGGHLLLQGLFPTRGSNLCLLHWQADSLPLVPPGKPLKTHLGEYVKVAKLCLTLCDPMDCTVHGILQARILEWVASHSLLQGIFRAQGSNPGLLDCRQILYHLRLQGSLTRPQSMGCLQPGALNGTFACVQQQYAQSPASCCYLYNLY